VLVAALTCEDELGHWWLVGTDGRVGDSARWAAGYPSLSGRDPRSHRAL